VTAAALLLLIIGGWWAIARISRLQNRVDQLEAEKAKTPAGDLQRQLDDERAKTGELAKQLQQERDERQKLEQTYASQREDDSTDPTRREQNGTGTFAIVLSPGMTRDAGGMKKVSIPRGASNVQLTLAVEGEAYRTYRASLQTAEGKEIAARGKLRPQPKGTSVTVSFSVPAKPLSNGDYQISLYGITSTGASEKVGTYTFRVLGN
jgi:hypothetical protein